MDARVGWWHSPYLAELPTVLPPAHHVALAWAAGFFDGEGCIQISVAKAGNGRWGPYHALRITASQRIKSPLVKLCSLFGGSIRFYTRKGHDIYVWGTSCREAKAALERMLPYLVVKKRQALVGLSFQSRRKRGGTRRSTVDLDEQDRLLLQRMKREDE